MIPRLFLHKEECYRYTRDAEDFFLWWGERDLNPRPVACKATALTAELPPLSLKILTSFPNTELRGSRPHSGPAVAEGVRIFGFISLAVSVTVGSPVGDSYLDWQRIAFSHSMYGPLCWEKKSKWRGRRDSNPLSPDRQSGVSASSTSTPRETFHFRVVKEPFLRRWEL